ncbi:Zinc finger protein 544 [Lucilia cuprina]|nr:Zinc finger protein 544 [Lucilia cuprina]
MYFNLEKQQCRACYNANKGLKHLTKCIGGLQKKSYGELLREVSNINIMDEAYKELPQFICESCSRKLKASNAFIQQTHEVNERLMAMLMGREEINNHLDCLQEAQVDIQSCLEIKMEHDEAGAEPTAEEPCSVALKLEEPEDFSQINHHNVQELGGKKDNEDENNSLELITLKETNEAKTDINASEHQANEDILNVDTTRADDKTKPLTDLFLADEGNIDDNGTCNKNSDSEDEDYQDDLTDDMDWQKEQKTNSSNSKKDDKKKITKKSRKSEETTEDDDVAVPCNQCNKIFNNSKALARHQRTSHIPEEQKCTCPLCFRKFSRSCNMYTHMRTFHGPDTVPLIRKPSTQERIFQCDKCPRNYTKKKHLNIHIKNKHSQENEMTETNAEKSTEELKERVEETPVKPNKPKRYEVRSLCSICGSSFSSKTHLIVHMRRHTGERPFKCDLCERAYPRISELTCHRRIHTGEKPFACKICGKTFRVSSKMTTHMRSHTDIRPYKCTQCERSFKYSKDLSIHFRIHTGERPYCCNVCGSTFTQSNTLKAHRVKLGHMDSVVEMNTNNLV